MPSHLFGALFSFKIFFFPYMNIFSPLILFSKRTKTQCLLNEFGEKIQKQMYKLTAIPAPTAQHTATHPPPTSYICPTSGAFIVVKWRYLCGALTFYTGTIFYFSSNTHTHQFAVDFVVLWRCHCHCGMCLLDLIT